MDNVKFIEVDGEEHAIIEHEDGSGVSMLKSTYDQIRSSQSIPDVTE